MIDRRLSLRQMVAAIDGELVLAVNGPDPIADETWDPYVEWCRQLPILPTTALTFSPQQSPNSAQRARLVKVMNERNVPLAHVAILTESTLVRGAITVFGWFVKMSSKPFKPSEIEEAMTWVGRAASFDRAAVRDFLRDAIIEVGYGLGQRDAWMIGSSKTG